MKKTLLLLALLALLGTGCQREGKTLGATVYFSFAQAAVKSLEVDDNTISDCNILVYDAAGMLQESAYCSTGAVPSLKMNLKSGELYRFYCVCNIGDICDLGDFERESTLLQYHYGIDDWRAIVSGSGCVPMSGNTGLMSVSDGMNISINLTRCVALVTIRIDGSGLSDSDIRVESIALRNTPLEVGLFNQSAPENSSQLCLGGDCAAEGELATFNNGEAVGFYMLENCQGDLLPGITSCRQKYFESGSRYENLCTYVELQGSLDAPSGANPRHGTFTYRFYLGENATTNFSVVRNHHYDIVLGLSDSGVDEVSWRVESDLTPYATAVTVTPVEHTFYGTGGSLLFSAEILPSSAPEEVTWSSSDPSVATVDQSGSVTAAGIGSCTIRATAADGSGVFGTAAVNVKSAAPRPISITPNFCTEQGWVLGCGSTTTGFKVTIAYDDGSTRILTGNDALATIVAGEGWVIGNGTLSAPLQSTAMEMLLLYTDPESGVTVSYSSEGDVIQSAELFTCTNNSLIIKRYGDSSDTPMVIENIRCYPAVRDLSSRITFTTGSRYLEFDGSGFRLKGSCTVNGNLSYNFTGYIVDEFDHLISKTFSDLCVIYRWRQRYYIVELDTMVREHIDVSPSSQEQPDNIKVTVYMHYNDADDETVNEYYFPASYDADGDLVMGDFTYTWNGEILRCHMLDHQSFIFDCDRDGMPLLDRYCYIGGTYYYYEPLD